MLTNLQLFQHVGVVGILCARGEAAKIQDGGRYIEPDLLKLRRVQFVTRLVEEHVPRFPDLEDVVANQLLVVGGEALHPLYRLVAGRRCVPHQHDPHREVEVLQAYIRAGWRI